MNDPTSRKSTQRFVGQIQSRLHRSRPHNEILLCECVQVRCWQSRCRPKRKTSWHSSIDLESQRSPAPKAPYQKQKPRETGCFSGLNCYSWPLRDSNPCCRRERAVKVGTSGITDSRSKEAKSSHVTTQIGNHTKTNTCSPEPHWQVWINQPSIRRKLRSLSGLA